MSFENFPYSNFHDLNLDWIINEWKKVYSTFTTYTEAFNSLKDFVANYFPNLDVQNEINKKLDNMIESGELEKIITLYFSYYVTPESYGCIGDGITDDTKNFQKALNSGLPVLLKNKYLITDTLLLKSGTELFGYKTQNWDLNAGVMNEKYPYIKFNPVNTSKYLFELDQTTIKNQYVCDISISNLQIEGSNVLGCFNFSKLANSKFSNLTIFGFQTIFNCDFLMRVNFDHINATGFLTAIKIINEITTTVTFRDCYFGQSQISNSNVLYCDKNTAYKILFDNCVFETLHKVCVSKGQNYIVFTSCYMENIPCEPSTTPVSLFDCEGDSILTKDVIVVSKSYIQGNNNYQLENTYVVGENEFVNFMLSDSVVKIFKNIFNPNFKGFATLNNNTEVSTNPVNISKEYGNYSNETNLVSYYSNPNSVTRDQFIALKNAWSNLCYIAINQDVVVVNVNGTCDGDTIGTFEDVSLTGAGEIVDATTGSDTVKVIIINGKVTAINPTEGHVYIGSIVLKR